MRRILRDIAQLGGIAATHELLRRGHHERYLTWAVANGIIVRVRNGWYCAPSLDPDLMRAARIGGISACVSAARHHGLWTPDRDSRHVVVDRRSARLRTPNDKRVRLGTSQVDGVVVHWAEPPVRQHRLVQSVGECLEQVVSCQSAEFAFAIIESALESRRMSTSEWARVAERCPPDRLARIGPVARGAGSGAESIFWHRLRALGVPIRRQVVLDGFARVDALIGDRLYIEIDSREFHDPIADAQRDARLHLAGYIALRFGVEHVMNDWGMVEAAVTLSLSRGDHRFA